jgi:hypothetical protein
MPDPETNTHYAMQCYATAMEFYQVYPVLVADQAQRHDFIAARLYNLCHALELTLKGWLVYTGQFSEKKLAQRYGHDLEKLAKKVQRLYGRSQELDACVGYIQILNPDYAGKSYEYPVKAFRGVDDASFAVAVNSLLNRLAQEVKSGRYTEAPLPVALSKTGFWYRIGDLVIRFGQWLKTFAD